MSHPNQPLSSYYIVALASRLSPHAKDICHGNSTTNVLFSEASKFLKLDVVLIHRHIALLEIAELLTLALNNNGGNVVSFEVPTEVSPSDHTSSSGIFVLLIPISGLVFELKGSELVVILRSDISTFKMLVDIHVPIIGVCGFGTVAERLGLICKELVEGSKLRLMVELPLTLI